ncbi:MAG: bifunctional DNA-formamidopyrimidine glycosylase/DNA-(apurinic or apyrimidinic site) lyase, partial [Dehalococcoidia bacterium]
GIRRRGKHIILELASHDVLILHLKMTGVLLIRTSNNDVQKHTTAVFRFDDGKSLHFNDQRKFGSLWLTGDEGEIFGKLGPEPLSEAFTTSYLRELVDRHNISIKALICDQNAIAGIGNMYADEALFTAGIYPLKRAGDLSDEEVERLRAGIVEALQMGIKHNGASINTYRLPDGAEGVAHTRFRVAHRRDESCYVCGTPITRVSIRNRGCYFCPTCQKE